MSATTTTRADSRVTDLGTAVSTYVAEGMTVAFEGFGHLIPSTSAPRQARCGFATRTRAWCFPGTVSRP